MKPKRELSAIRREAGKPGLENQKAWREHALAMGADFLAVEYLTRPERFRDGEKACEAYTGKTDSGIGVKKAFHDGLAAAVLEVLHKNEAAFTPPASYWAIKGHGQSKVRVPTPFHDLPKTITPPKTLKAESVRDLFKDPAWRSRLNDEFAARVTVRQEDSSEPLGPESDASVVAAAEQIRRLIERG